MLTSIAFNLTRAAGSLASRFHACARLATLRAHLINVPGRLARSGRPLTLHLRQHWRWQRPPTMKKSPRFERKLTL